MAKVSKGVLGKTLTALPILALASAAWVVTLAGLAIARHFSKSRSELQPLPSVSSADQSSKRLVVILHC